MALATVVMCIGLMCGCTSTASAWSGSASASPSSAYIGDTMTYELNLKNTGDSSLQINSATLTIDWGAATTTRDMSGAVALAPGATGKLTCSFKIPAVTPNIYAVTIDIDGKAVGDWFADTQTYTTTLTVKDVPDLSVTVTSLKTTGTAPFTASMNAVPNGGVGPLSYTWSFGDGTTSTTTSPSHIYSKGGSYTATCTVTDSKGQTASDSLTFVVQGNPTDITDSSSGGGGSFGGVSPLLIIGIIIAAVAVIAVIFVVARKK